MICKQRSCLHQLFHCTSINQEVISKHQVIVNAGTTKGQSEVVNSSNKNVLISLITLNHLFVDNDANSVATLPSD